MRVNVLSSLIAALLFSACGARSQSVPTPIDADQYPQETATQPPRLALASATPAATGAARVATGASRPLPGTPAPASIAVLDFEFQPASITVQRGSTVTWTNGGKTVHRLVADSGAFDKGQMAPGRSVEQVFSSQGSFSYHCAIHPTMRGAIIVP